METGSALSLFDDLEQRGFIMEVLADGKLLVKPRADLSPTDIEEISTHKVQLMFLVQHPIKPTLLEDGTVRFPFNVRAKYRHWRTEVDPKAQSLFATLVELGATLKSWRKYGSKDATILTEKHRCGSEDWREYPALVEGTKTYPAFVCCKGCGWWYADEKPEKKEDEAK